jgi:hypothetical protein
MRFRVTVRGTDVELRGVVDGGANLEILGRRMKGIGPVVASYADDDYDPFPREVTDAEVELAVNAYKAPRLHVNDTRHDRMIDMRAALEAFVEARNG